MMNYTTVGDCCDILDSQRVPVTASDRIKGIYPYYGANGVQDYVDDFLFDDELVLVAEDGGHFGSKEHPIAYRVSGKCWVNNHAHVLKPHEGIDVDYLCYSLMYYPVQSLIKGATRKKLNQADLRKMKIVLRPLDEQTRIVALIKEAEGESKICREIVAKLDTLVKSRFIEMFGDPVTNPMGWEVKKLKDISRKISDGVHAKPEYTGEGKPFLSVVNINKGKVDFSNCKFVSQSDYEKMIKSTNPEKGDVLYTKVGATYGIPAYVDTDEKFCLYVSVCLIKPRHELVNARFLTESMRLPYIKHQADRRIRGIGVPDLHLNQISEFDVLCPPMELQERYIDFVTQVDKSKSVLQKLLEKQELLQAALMQEYFG